MADLDIRPLRGHRHQVIRHRRIEELAVLVIAQLLVERRADALHHAAMHLAGEQDRVHRDAKIVDDGVADDRRGAGLRIDLNLADMGAVRIGALVLDEFAKALEVVRFPGRLGDRREIDRAVGADDTGNAVGELDVAR